MAAGKPGGARPREAAPRAAWRPENVEQLIDELEIAAAEADIIDRSGFLALAIRLRRIAARQEAQSRAP